jgi:hypothetical protein
MRLARKDIRLNTWNPHNPTVGWADAVSPERYQTKHFSAKNFPSVPARLPYPQAPHRQGSDAAYRERERDPMLSSLVTRDLARRLLDCDSVAASISAQTEPPNFRVYEKLRHRLGASLGADAFQALASRALRIARSESPRLHAVQVTADGRLQSLGLFEPQTDTDQEGEDGVILIARLLDLFLAFIGPALTLQLLRDLSPVSRSRQNWSNRRLSRISCKKSANSGA